MQDRSFFLASPSKSLLTLGAAAVAVTVACGGGGGGPSGSPAGPNPPAAAGPTITITSSGVSPKDTRLSTGGRVTFVNQDSRSHEMMSDPHPVHTGCPEINAVGDLAPGQSRVTGAFGPASRTCGFHDSLQDGNTALRGTITIGEGGPPPTY